MTHVLLASTRETLKKRHFTSLQQAAKSLGFEASFAPTIGRVLADPPGPVSLANENRIRTALGLPGRTRRRYIRPCLDHDPAVRLGQLRALLAECEAAIEAQP